MADAGQVFDKFLKLPDYQKLITLGVVIALLAVGYYYGIHAPKVIELEAKQQELTKLNAQYSEQQRVLVILIISGRNCGSCRLSSRKP